MLDYKLLEALAMVVQEGGFDRASKVLFLTQSAVSQRVRHLEERVGQVLLSRTSPPLPTSAGLRLLKHYRQVKLLEEDLDGVLQPENDLPVTLCLGVNADSLEAWLLEAVRPFLEQGTGLIDLRVDDQEQTHRLLRDGEVVGCISTTEKPMQGCRSEYLGCMRYRLMATEDFARQWFPQGVNRETICRAPAVIYNRKDNLHYRLLTQVFGAPCEQIPAHFVPSSTKFLEFITTGLAYGMVEEHEGRNLPPSSPLVELAPGHQISERLYWHRWNLDSPLLDDLSNHLVRGAKLFLALI